MTECCNENGDRVWARDGFTFVAPCKGHDRRSRDVRAELERLEAYLHARLMHPDYEYAETNGPRKNWMGVDKPPQGDGWERNVHAGRDGWERFDYHEESYWMRPLPEDDDDD